MKRKNVLTIILASILLLTVVAVTYAFFQGGVNNAKKQTATVTTGTMELTFADNDQGIGAVMNFGDTITKKFTIENTGTVDAYAKISWLDMINTYLDGSIIYTLEYSDTENGTYRKILTEKNVPRSETISTIELANGLLVPAETKRYYNLHITLVYSETVDQTADLNATFSTYFTIENGTASALSTLIAMNLSDDVKKNPGYNMFNYTFTGYYYDNETAQFENMSGQYICAINEGQVTFSFNPNGATKETCNTIYYHSELGYMDSTIEDLFIGVATWDSLNNKCMYNGTEVYSINSMDTLIPATEGECGNVVFSDDIYLTGIQKAGQGSWAQIGTTEGLYETEDDFGKSYFFRGSKDLNNIVEFGEYDTDMHYYTVNSPNSGPFLAYSTGTLEHCENEKSSTTDCSTSTKYASAGDKMYWRIVRINGDGSVRLMYIGIAPDATGMDSYAGLSNYNTNYSQKEGTGYTYNNTLPNQGNGPESDIKIYLEKWYSRVFTTEDKYITYSQFANDTNEMNFDQILSYQSTYRNYTSPYKTPILKSTLTDQLYGGIYNLKVGLLNIDELTFSGINGASGSKYDEIGEIYPYTVNVSKTYWTITPAAYQRYAFNLTLLPEGQVSYSMLSGALAVVPVINLSAETAQQLIGSGSEIDPYRLNQ